MRTTLSQGTRHQYTEDVRATIYATAEKAHTFCWAKRGVFRTRAEVPSSATRESDGGRQARG